MARLAIAVISLPFELGARLVDDLPRRISKVEQRLDSARSTGRMVIDRGAGRADDQDRSVAVPPDSTARDDRPSPPVPAVADSEVSPPIVDLALADYDQLPASNVVAMLDDLTAAEVAAIEAHERANRQRRTVLGKIDQLRTSS